MKHIVLFLFSMMVSCTALAWEVSEEMIAFAAQVAPGYTLLDGVQYDDTALLLVEDAQGMTYFAGCVRSEDEWLITLSAPFTDWMRAGPDGYQMYEDGVAMYFAVPPEYRAYEDADWLDVYIDLQPDGTWRIRGVNTGWDVIEFRRHSIYDDCGYAFFGDWTISPDITQVDWARLPRSFHQAMALLDPSTWRLIREDDTPVCTIDGEIGWYAAAGAAVRVVSAADGMAEVRFPGREDTGWVDENSLLPGKEQSARYDAWVEDGFLYGVRDVILEDDDPAVSWYTFAHDERCAVPFPVEHVEYVYLQGWCAEGCCCLLYSDTLGASAFVPFSQLPYLPQ